MGHGNLVASIATFKLNGNCSSCEPELVNCSLSGCLPHSHCVHVRCTRKQMVRRLAPFSKERPASAQRFHALCTNINLGVIVDWIEYDVYGRKHLEDGAYSKKNSKLQQVQIPNSIGHFWTHKIWENILKSCAEFWLMLSEVDCRYKTVSTVIYCNTVWNDCDKIVLWYCRTIR